MNKFVQLNISFNKSFTFSKNFLLSNHLNIKLTSLIINHKFYIQLFNGCLSQENFCDFQLDQVNYFYALSQSIKNSANELQKFIETNDIEKKDKIIFQNNIIKLKERSEKEYYYAIVAKNTFTDGYNEKILNEEIEKRKQSFYLKHIKNTSEKSVFGIASLLACPYIYYKIYKDISITDGNKYNNFILTQFGNKNLFLFYSNLVNLVAKYANKQQKQEMLHYYRESLMGEKDFVDNVMNKNYLNYSESRWSNYVSREKNNDRYRAS